MLLNISHKEYLFRQATGNSSFENISSEHEVMLNFFQVDIKIISTYRRMP